MTSSRFFPSFKYLKIKPTFFFWVLVLYISSYFISYRKDHLYHLYLRMFFKYSYLRMLFHFGIIHILGQIILCCCGCSFNFFVADIILPFFCHHPQFRRRGSIYIIPRSAREGRQLFILLSP
jgi:hypothetical protein